MRYASRTATGRSCWAPACDEAAGQRTRAEPLCSAVPVGGADLVAAVQIVQGLCGGRWVCASPGCGAMLA
jgi:hypothetical protein